jgi:hypothetical protein
MKAPVVTSRGLRRPNRSGGCPYLGRAPNKSGFTAFGSGRADAGLRKCLRNGRVSQASAAWRPLGECTVSHSQCSLASPRRAWQLGVAQRWIKHVDGVIGHALHKNTEAGYVTSWNAGAQRFKGYTADEIIAPSGGSKEGTKNKRTEVRVTRRSISPHSARWLRPGPAESASRSRAPRAHRCRSASL